MQLNIALHEELLDNQEVSSDLNKSFSYYASAARQNHLDAKKHLEQLAYAGNAQAQFALGYEYYRVINNILDATYWCTHASIQEHELACNYLKNTQFDAAVYFKIASQYESAKIHQAQNQKRAISFYTEAFKLNHQDAGVKLGNFYLYGYGEIN